MKKALAIVVFVFSFSTADADEAKGGSFGALVSNLSSLLSSTNPAVSYNNSEPKTGEVPVVIEPKTRISQLPPLMPEPEPVAAPIPRMLPKLVPIDSANEQVIKLSPQTKKLMEMTPSNIGRAPRQLSGKLLIQHGQFENDVPAPAPVATAETKPAPAKAKFEISVNDAGYNDSIDIMLEKALNALKIGQYDSAVALYKMVLKKQPSNQDALFGIAAAYHKNGQRKEAKAAYAQLMAKYPNFKDGITNVLLFASEEAPDDALVELNNLAKKNPRFAPIFAQEAAIYNRRGDYKSAIADLSKALNLEPGNILYMYNLATSYDHLGDSPNAIKLYNQLLELNYKGQDLPVPRQQFVDRVAYLGSQKIAMH